MRYLSEEWFAAATRDGGGEELGDGPGGGAHLVLEQVVHGTPDGTVVYRVELAGGGARIIWPVPAEATAADLRISTDWDTAVALARGDLSAQRALMQGRLRVRGSPDRLAEAELGGVDAVPPDVRAATSFEPAAATAGKAPKISVRPLPGGDGRRLG